MAIKTRIKASGGRFDFLRAYGSNKTGRGCLSLAVAGAFSAAVMFAPSHANAESLYEALISAYVKNPTLRAARAEQRATDENVARARSGFRPRIEGNAEIGFQDINRPGTVNDGQSEPRSYGVTLTQPIFRGFRTINAVRGAEATVAAGQQNLKITEQQTLLDAVTAYMNVVRDQAIVRLRRNNVRVLREQSQATKDRFEVGEVTKTDVAQSDARLAGTKSALSAAQADLDTSRATYRQVIGHEAKQLSGAGKYAQVVPKSLDDALEVGLRENPTVVAAKYVAKASRYDVDQVRGELLPEVSVEASYGRAIDQSVGSFGVGEQESTTVAGRVRVPLYQAGDVSARIRQSKQTYQQRRDQVDEASDRARRDIVSQWGTLKAVRAQLLSDQAQARANRIALKGVREEEQVGQRTILEVLDAEQELLDAEVALVQTRSNLVIATFNILAFVGRLTAEDLGLAVEYYDPNTNYKSVRRKWFGTGPRLPPKLDH